MSDVKAKIHQIRFRLGIRPRPRWGSWNLGGLLLREGMGGEGKGGREGREEGMEKGRRRRGLGWKGKERERGERRGERRVKERGWEGVPLLVCQCPSSWLWLCDVYVYQNQLDAMLHDVLLCAVVSRRNVNPFDISELIMILAQLHVYWEPCRVALQLSCSYIIQGDRLRHRRLFPIPGCFAHSYDTRLS